MTPVTERVSVVIPTRNRRQLLARALGTALAQQDVGADVVVVDDASDDGTAEYLGTLDDRRVRVVRHESPQGVSAARNAGVAAATAPWTAFLDDDDVWAPRKLATQLEAIAGTPGALWACAGAIILTGELRPTARQRLGEPVDTPTRLLAYNVVPGGASGVLASTELVRRLGGFDLGLRVFADWDLWIRLARASPVAYADAPLVGYVLHGANMTAQPGDVLDELERIRARTAEARAEHGVDVDRDSWEAWFADMSRRGGARLRPGLTYARLAVRTHRPYYAMRALTVALLPGWVERQDRKRRAVLDDRWRAEAEGWLQPLRREPG